jgi:hypothetical protein
MELENAGHPRTLGTPDKEYAITAAVERAPWRISSDMA